MPTDEPNPRNPTTGGTLRAATGTSLTAATGTRVGTAGGSLTLGTTFPTAGTLGTAAATPAAAFTTGPLFIDVSDRPITSNIVRDGAVVPAVNFDPVVVGSFLDPGRVIKLPERVVRQSIPAGSRVPVGTVVDLVLAPTSIIPLNVFDGVHADFQQFEVVGGALELLNNSAVRKITLDYATAAEVPADKKAQLVTELSGLGINVVADDPERGFDRAFGTLRNVAAFR